MAEYPPLTADEVNVLREIGQRWGSAFRDRRPRQTELPLDPTLGRYPPTPTPTRFGRLAPIEMFRAEKPDELVATVRAGIPESRLGRALARVRRVVLGPPLTSAALLYERMRKLVALPVLSSDLLSSVAYGPEAMLTILALAGSSALGLSLPIAAALVVLMIVVGLSYRQTIPAYPHGAGSYIVASDNLGRRSGLAAAAGLMMDYILTVSVSVSAGIHAVTSALPALTPLTVPLGLLMIAVLLAGNLRGVRAAGTIFAAPTYLFLGAMVLLLGVGLAQVAGRGFTPTPPPPVPAVEGLSLLLVLRAFSSGATSMTGIEAVSNAVPAFRAPEWRNARTTLTWMVSLLIVMFAGLMVLIHLDGVVPRPEETVLSQLAHRTFPTGPWYVIIQAATALILLFAANTAYNDFPRLLFFMARDGYAPRRFLHMGDRLAFSNGIIALSVGAGLIFFAFGGKTQSLIPLFAVGVFLAFSLSQAGMVVHWRRVRGRHWRRRQAVNGVGSLLCALVMLTAAITKFAAGAWVVVIVVPAIILLALGIRRHYNTVERALRLHPPATTARKRLVPTPAQPANGATGNAATQETEESPQEVRHLVVVPVARFDLAALRALAYAASLGSTAFAVHISPDEEEADRFREQWENWGDHLRLEIIVSPYRAIIPPLAHYFATLHTLRPDISLTVVLPEIVIRHRWHELLHSRTPQRLRRALRHLPGIVITSVPIHLSE
ncbi:APC family permease [Micromonospora sp. NPDC049301]|uniref:APC family permease n=1 Tax=Micromonospora sp. NPDC049301 TaxID=3155723 RepID=UPI003435E8FF